MFLDHTFVVRAVGVELSRTRHEVAAAALRCVCVCERERERERDVYEPDQKGEHCERPLIVCLNIYVCF